MIRWLIGAIGLCIVAGHAVAAEPIEIGIGYLGRAGVKSKLSLIDQPAENDGVAGARLAIEDNNTTGKFLNQRFALQEVRLKEGEDAAQAAVELAHRNGFIIADLPADALLKVADAGRERGTVLFNAGATDDRLREEDCRANVIHVAPTRSMLADALAQYLVWKQWQRWLLVVGSHDQDKLYADALRRAADALRRQDRAGTRHSRIPAARGAPTAASPRSSVRFRCSRNRRRPTTCSSRPTRARSSPPTCPIAPGTRGRSRAPQAWCREAGTPRRSNGARSRCRTASSS